tara:strand:- start:45 stop:572 length:528 start_codon:yes stop_codon:yes gene_type:complete
MPEFNSVPFDEVPQPHEEDTYTIEEEQSVFLTRNEALFLDDSFTLMIEQEIEDLRIKAMRPVQMTAALAVPMELMAKVGKAVLYTTNPNTLNKDYEVIFDLSELLMIREVASSYIKIGEEPVGYNLKRKVCAVLYAEELKQDETDELAAHLLKDMDVSLFLTKVEHGSDKQNPDS